MTKEIDVAQVKALGKLFKGRLIWTALAFLLMMVFLFTTVRIGRITGEEVGVLLSKVSGKVTVISESGVKIYNGITSDFFALDKTIQTLEMTGRGSRTTLPRLKIKTMDGSDVYVDLKVQFKIIPDQADVIIATSGPGAAFKYKWAGDYVRSICRNYLGELTTEEFYDAAKRNVKIIQAQKEADKRLTPFGMEIDSVVMPKKPRFYKEYEEMIKRKKLADQAVLEERSKAQAAKQRQMTVVVEETNKKNVAVEQFSGQMRQAVIAADAMADRVTKESDAYYDRVTIGAEADLYRLTKYAEAIIARKEAEAKGIEALKKALEGEGGRNMVKLEYAKKLKNVTFSGKPFTISSNTERFEHLGAPASKGRLEKGEAKK